MKEFEYFIIKGNVKKQKPDINLAKATARESLDRLEFAKALFLTQKPKYTLENSYEAIRELIDAILYLDGYKSYSHEASIAYLFKIGFSISDINSVDKLRKQRNGIKYYGESISKEGAEEALKMAGKIIGALLNKKPFFGIK